MMLEKKNPPKNKHTKYPPKLIKMGKEKQALTLNLLSVYLSPASPSTLFALQVLGKQRQGTLCLVTHFQPGEGVRNRRTLAKWDMCSSKGQLLQTGRGGHCASVLCLALKMG